MAFNWKKTIRIPVTGAAIVVIILCLFVTPPAKRFAFNYLCRYLERSAGIQIEASSVSLSYFHGRAIFENLTAGSAASPELPPLFRATRATLDINVLKAISGKIIFEEITLIHPEIYYFSDDEGRNNIPVSPVSGYRDGDGNMQEILIARAEVSDGVFQYNDTLQDLFINLPGWNLDVTGDVQTFLHHITFNTHMDADLRYGNTSTSIKTLLFDGNLDLKKNIIGIESARFATAGLSTDITGDVDFSALFSGPFVNLAIRTDADLSQIAAFAALEFPVHGSMSGEIHASGDLGSLEASARLGISGLVIHSYGLNELDLAVKGSLCGDSGRLIFPEITVLSQDGNLSGKADLAVFKASGKSSVSAEINDLNLRPLIKFAGASLDVAARAAGTISLEWEGDFNPDRATATALITLSDDSTGSEAGAMPLSGNLGARLENNLVEITVPELKVLDIETAGWFTMKSFRDINGELAVKGADIQTTITRIARFLDIEELHPVVGELAGSASFSIRAEGNLDQPEIMASLEIPELSFRNLKTDSRSDFFLRDGTLEFTGGFGLPQNTTAGFKGSLDFSGDDLVVLATAELENVPIVIINDVIIDSQIPLSGFVCVSADISGPISNLRGNAVVTGKDLFLYEKPVGHLYAGFVLSDQKIHSEKFLLQRNREMSDETSEDIENSLTARFFYALDSGRFDLHAEGNDLTLNDWKLSENIPVPEKINLSVSAEGTIDQPHVKARVVADDLKLKLNGEETRLGAVVVTADIVSNDAIIAASAPLIGLSADAIGSLSAPWTYTVELRANKSDISAIGLKVMQDELPFSGVIDAVVRANGNLETPGTMEVDADIKDLILLVQPHEARLFSPTRLRYRAGVLEIADPALLVTRSSQLEISGRVPLEKNQTAETVKLQGRVNLAEALSFTPVPDDLEVDGILTFDVDTTVLNGTYGARGNIAMERGTVSVPGSPLPFNSVHIDADIEGGTLVLRNTSAEWGRGEISVYGEIPLRALPWSIPGMIADDGPVEFTVDVRNVTPEATGILPQGMTGRVSLHADGIADHADLESLRAEIIFDEFSFNMDALNFYQPAPSRISIRDGMATFSSFAMVGPETNLRLGGSANLLAPEIPLDLQLEGFLSAAILTFGDPDLKADGRLNVQIDTKGTILEPTFTGYAETNNGRFTLRNPRIVADDLRARLAVTPGKIRVERFDGLLNGGSLTGDGSLGYTLGALNDIDLRLSFNDCFLEALEGLRSSSSGTITITSQEEAIEIGGNVRIAESLYAFEIGQATNYLRSQQMVITDLAQNSILDHLRFNISVRTITPLLVRSNVARVEADASGLRLVGTYREPSVTGRVTLTEGGTITLIQREYYIDRGVVTFVNQNRIEPELDIQARTKVAGYDITLQLAGNPDRLTTIFTSDPSLPETDIISLLFTGRTSAETQGREIQVAQSQTLSLLAGLAGEQLTGSARRALHLSTLRIDPDFIAAEADPGARLTIGEDITRDLSLAYSMNLINGGDQIWAAQYALTRQFTTQATRQQDNSYRFEFRHDIRLGSATVGRTGSARTGAQGSARSEIGEIRFTGEVNFAKNTLLKHLNAASGNRYDFQKVQRGLDKLHDLYTSESHLESDIRMRREVNDGIVDIEIDIEPGPVVRFSFEGFHIASKTRRDVENAWIDGVFEAGRVEDAVAVLRRAMIKDGYLEAEILVEVENFAENVKDVGQMVRDVKFHITPGLHYSGVRVRFPGATEISEEKLRDAIKNAGFESDVYADPGKVSAFIRNYYREYGYLEARASDTRLDLNPETGAGQAVIEVYEGPLFIIGDLEFTGNNALGFYTLWAAIPTSSGSFYSPESLLNSIKAIENIYRRRGYNDVSVAFKVMQDTPKASAHLTFQITERRQSFIENIEIDGNQRTSLQFVIRQLDFEAGDVLDFEKINESRRRLYATGVYSSVDFITDEIVGSDMDPTRKNVRVRLRLRENAPYRLQYGLYYDTDRGPGGIAEAQSMNVMGRASNLGFRARYDSDLQEGRVYYRQPHIRDLHLKMDTSVFVQKEQRSSYSARRLGFSLTQERAISREYRIDYGYRYDHVRWEPENVILNPAMFQSNVPVARLTATLTRDTRDDIWDATRGEFATHTVEFGPTWLGSEIGFVRYSGQYFRYVPIDKFLGLSVRDTEGNALPPRFVYAGAIRLGLTSSFGDRDLISPERFFAGGGNTMRGFEQDMLGPLELHDDGRLIPKGGEGMFIFNSEIRFPIWSVLHGVGFMDIGNVYSRLGDFDFSLRKTAGAGVLLKTSFFLPLRFDYGFKLDRRTGERSGTFFFSIGQAF